MRQDIQKLKKDMRDVRATQRNMAVALTRIEDKVDHFVERLHEDFAGKAEIDALIGRIDGFLGIVESSRDERKMSDKSFADIRETLLNHEARLIRLEPKKH